MKNISSIELRRLWNDFWESKNHKHLPEVSLISSKESTAMFNVAGMQQLIPYLVGKEHQLGPKLYNIQKCIRTVDIDEVWDNSHLTFFEMMGNWSLWDYFKEDSIKRSYEFLVDTLWFDKKKLAVTVHSWDTKNSIPQDDMSYNTWKKLWFTDDKIAFLEENWRSPGPVWPCGPDSEIFYRVWDTEFPPKDSDPWNDEDNWLEIWNNVFMEFYWDNWKVTPLKQQNVDTGMWFERLCKVLQNKETIFETDLFVPLIKILEDNLWLKYEDNKRRFRIVVDHLRSAIILVNDGVIQSNVWAGYVLRMIIRRMYYNLLLIKKIDLETFKQILQNFVQETNKIRDLNFDLVINSIFEEVTNFEKTINRGMKVLEEKISKLEQNWILDCKDCFFLYDTCGFPLELTKEICEDKWVKIDEDWFQNELEKQKEKSRKNSKWFSKDIDWSKHLDWIKETTFVWYNALESTDPELIKDIQIDEQRFLIFDKTPFYAESGWQTWDLWTVELDDGTILNVLDVIKYEWVFIHLVE